MFVKCVMDNCRSIGTKTFHFRGEVYLLCIDRRCLARTRTKADELSDSGDSIEEEEEEEKENGKNGAEPMDVDEPGDCGEEKKRK
jgi:hypothetical protein